MSRTHTFRREMERDGKVIFTGVENVTGGSEPTFDEAIPEDATTEFNFPLDVSALQSIAFFCDRDVTIETNGTGENADDTLSIKAGKGKIWTLDSGDANPFASDTDVATIHVTLAAGSNAQLIIEALVDPAA